MYNSLYGTHSLLVHLTLIWVMGQTHYYFICVYRGLCNKFIQMKKGAICFYLRIRIGANLFILSLLKQENLTNFIKMPSKQFLIHRLIFSTG